MGYRLTGIILATLWISQALAVGTNFTYQGELQVASAPAQGSYDFEFSLFDAQSDGAGVGPTQSIDAVAVSNGIFTVDLDFGINAFDGTERWLEIRVKLAANTSFVTLSPRQGVSPAPYAIRSETAMVADGALLADAADAVPYLGVTGRPTGLDDGDDDTLNALSCSTDQVASFDGAAWVCADQTGDTLESLSCANGQIPVFDGSVWACGNQSADTLGSLSCTNGQIPVFDGAAWICGNRTVDTLNALSCTPGQIVAFDGNDWGCGDAPTDTLAQLTCSNGQIAVFNGAAWVCGEIADGSPSAVCAQSDGTPGMVLDGVCLLDYSNSLSSTWNTAASACAAIGGDLCTASQYDGLRAEGAIVTTSSSNNDFFASGRAVWSNNFSDNDGNVKFGLLRSTDDPSVSLSYSYGCCGNVLPEPARSNAQVVNGVLVTQIHTAQDTVWRAAARACRSKGADLCSKSQYVALNDASTFTAAVRRATNELSDNDGDLFSAVVGTNADDNGALGQQWAYSCCSTSRPVDRSCAGTLISGICVLEINDADDTNFFDAARACTSQGADICSNSQMEVLRDFGQFASQCWTASGGDNDSSRVGGLLGTEPDNANPLTDLRGYACCQ
ncbi:MAG: hypothetical protein AB8B96_20320 [Lysobacterales bacterium]